MRPKSLLFFDLLFFAALAAGIVNSLLALADVKTQINTTRVISIFGGAENLIYGSVAFSVVISLLLWFFISRRASNIAKWIQVVFNAFGLLSLASIAIDPTALNTADVAIIIITNALQVAATTMLFRADSRAWFAGRRPVDPDVFS